jgi:hypothetical protein
MSPEQFARVCRAASTDVGPGQLAVRTVLHALARACDDLAREAASAPVQPLPLAGGRNRNYRMIQVPFRYDDDGTELAVPAGYRLVQVYGDGARGHVTCIVEREDT